MTEKIKNLYLDLHVLQTLPSSNINRDDTGAPKTALYGGVTRSRVSSQSWKKAMRAGFKADRYVNGIRTKAVIGRLADELSQVNPHLKGDDNRAKAIEAAGKALVKIGIIKSSDLKADTTDIPALAFVSPGQLHKLAEYVTANSELFADNSKELIRKQKKEVQTLFNGSQTLDLALFGRMFANSPELNVDGAAQIAHAISTHELVPEYDYYTAMDDLKTADQSGAGMLGTTSFNSATLYRYANVNVPELVRNLGAAATVAAVKEFIKTFVETMPTGKQNSFAAKTMPSYVLVTLRTDTPVNLASAFEDPVTSETGYMQKSITALENEFKTVQDFIGNPTPLLAKAVVNPRYQSAFDGSDILHSLPAVLPSITAIISQRIEVPDDADVAD